MDFDWHDVVKKIKHNFDCLGATSIQSIEHPIYGELCFHWVGNKKELEVAFIHTSWNCICKDKSDDFMCDCDWKAFQEGPPHPHISFTKKEVEFIKLPKLF
jgi:hypothetical protein